MQLFKRALLSLFPDEIANQNVNPASMFVSFISTKEFFSVINRKIIENYKLNLFDISLDPFEFKTGFGDNPHIKPKDNAIYYGYCAVANLNGYRFLNCANISNSITLVISIYTKDIFRKYGSDAYLNFLYTTFLLSFVFLARIKIFPHKNKEDNYNRFIDVFFDFYGFVYSQTGKKISKEEITNIKKDLLNEIEIFFLLFTVYQKFNSMLTNSEITDKDFYYWIFYDELSGDHKTIINEFIQNCDQYNKQPAFSAIETKILQFILPADILIRYLFMDMEMFSVTENIISKIYDKKILDKYMSSFRNQENELENFLLYITDYKHFKKNFFTGVQKYLITALRHQGFSADEELDDLMSSIGDDIENIENLKIPERIKKESKIMEKILNFYITFVGGFRTSRGDNFFIRLFRKSILDEISKSLNAFDQKNQNLYYYGSLLYNYGKNVFYYKFASENVRAGKQKFFLPYKSNFKNIYSNLCILKLFDENFIATILQDINPKDIRIFIKNKKILDLFKSTFGKEISSIVKKEKKELINHIYSPIGFLLSNFKNFLHTIQKNLTDQDIYHLKENIYSLDFWLSQTLYQSLINQKINLTKHFSDTVILGIFANFRETLFGLLLYISFLYLEEKTKTNGSNAKPNNGIKKDLKINIIKKLYISDILNLNINEEYKQSLIKIIDDIYIQSKDIMQSLIAIDDNRDFLMIGVENRTNFISDKSEEEILKKVIGEDIIRFRGFLKNITYYNKRFLIPK